MWIRRAASACDLLCDADPESVIGEGSALLLVEGFRSYQALFPGSRVRSLEEFVMAVSLLLLVMMNAIMVFM